MLGFLQNRRSTELITCKKVSDKQSTFTLNFIKHDLPCQIILIILNKKEMETIILSGDSKSNAKLLLELAKKLNFSVKIISELEREELGIFYSTKEGLSSGLLVEEDKNDFISSLNQ